MIITIPFDMEIAVHFDGGDSESLTKMLLDNLGDDFETWLSQIIAEEVSHIVPCTGVTVSL